MASMTNALLAIAGRRAVATDSRRDSERGTAAEAASHRRSRRNDHRRFDVNGTPVTATLEDNEMSRDALSRQPRLHTLKSQICEKLAHSRQPFHPSVSIRATRAAGGCFRLG